MLGKNSVMRRGITSLLGVAAVASLTNLVVPPTASADPANECRAGNAAAQKILPTIEPFIKHWLGVQPDSTTPGFSMAVVAPDPVLAWKSSIAVINCGVTALGGSMPTTTDTIWEMGSETKVFDATALAQMLLRKQVSLDDQLQKFLPAGVTPPDQACGASTKAPITLRDLATHNSGLLDVPRNTTWSNAHPEGRENYTRQDLYESFSKNFSQACEALLFTPGTSYSYSNWGFATLAAVLADTYTGNSTGVPAVPKLLNDLVINRLGLKNTRFEVIPPVAGIATPTCAAGISTPCYFNNVNAWAGGGGLVTTIGDMATFTAANLGFDKNPTIWPALELTHKPVGYGPACDTPPNATPTCLGLAWQITPPNAAGSHSVFTTLDKDGGTNGMHSHTYLLPDACWGVTFLSNSNTPLPFDPKGLAGTIISTIAPTTSQCFRPALGSS